MYVCMCVQYLYVYILLDGLCTELVAEPASDKTKTPLAQVRGARATLAGT